MKRALKGTITLDLHTTGPEILQNLYEDGKKGLLACTICHEAVRLYLGIHEEPHFYHISNKSHCDDTSSSIKHTVPSEEAFIERNGFKIPVSRVITQSTPEVNRFRKSVKITRNPAFVEAAKVKEEIPSSYLSLLKNEGVHLDAQQMEAATSIQGPLLVLSGAGSGKTRVLTVRTAFMLREYNIDPKSIMLVTFTAKAAKEMKERLLTYPGMTLHLVNQIVSGTFHSIFYRILLFHEPHKWQRDFLIKWEWEKEQIIKMAGKELDLDEKDFPYDNALQQIGLWKNTLLSPQDVKPSDEWEEKCIFLYKRYEEYKNKHNKYDFDDMLIGCYQLLKENQQILETYQQRFQYFLIDEFQDINKVQYELIKMLSKRSQNICVVGDDDQSIYSFRGSNPGFILHFEEDFPHAKIIKLTNNYRSSHEIVSTANRIIQRNQDRRVKKMRAQHNNGDAPILFYPFDEEQEATMIVTDLQEKMANGANPGDFAILFRTHSMSRAIFERLAQSNLPFVIDQDADSFYNRRIVKGMIAFLRLSIDPDNQQAIADLLPSLFLKQSILQTIKAQSILEDCTLLEALSHVKTGFAFQEKKLKSIPRKILSLKSLTPALALETIEKDLGFQDFIKKRGNEGNAVEKGSDDVRDLKVAAKRFQSVQEFLDHADHMKAMNSEVKKLSKHFHDAITLTSIHRAKGLEYKSVYVLGVVDGGLPHDYALDSYRKGSSEGIEEERRLLYVAATRAKDELFLSVPETRRGKTASPSRFLKGLT